MNTVAWTDGKRVGLNSETRDLFTTLDRIVSNVLV